MFTRKTAVAVALVLGVTSAYSLAQLKKGNIASLRSGAKALSKCEVHGTALRLGTAPILYGKRNYPVPSLIHKSQFPHGSSYAMGGCVVSGNAPTLQQVKFCPQCRAGEERWLQAHKVAIPKN